MSENVMNYKGYSASVEYSAEDRCFVGRVLGIRDIIGFHGESVGELERDFRETIDFYLESCQKRGKEPDRPFDGKLVLKLPKSLYRMISRTSDAVGKPVDAVVLDALKTSDFAAMAKNPKRDNRAACKKRASSPLGRRSRKAPVETR